jgi:predicted enzyme related to lactoylglutathione lyase
MTDPSTLPPGAVGWRDLTVPDANLIRKFYEAVVGWRSEEMDGDFNMFSKSLPDPVAGICYAKGINAKLPPAWLIYIIVEDATESAKTAVELGGRIIDGPKAIGEGAMCVIQDPAGAYLALYQPGPPARKPTRKSTGNLARGRKSAGKKRRR